MIERKTTKPSPLDKLEKGIKDKNDYIALKYELSQNAGDYSEAEVVAIVNTLIAYAVTHLTDEETVCEGYDYQYEYDICDIGLRLDAFFQKKPVLKKSKLLQDFIIALIDHEDYRNGRDSFIYLLYRLKMDDDLRRLATERKVFWETPRLQFQLLYALYRRNIRGFEHEVEQLMTDQPKGDICKYAKKYLEKQAK